jgi:hypothetical protein
MFPPIDRRALAADWRSRIYHKLKPVQIRLLQEFGLDDKTRLASHELLDCSTGDCHEVLEGKLDLADRSTRSLPVLPPGSGPSCVCGGELKRVETRTRILRILADQPGWDPSANEASQILDGLIGASVITCDLCEETIKGGALWTCVNGPRTILHPAQYDVCHQCFCLYTGNAAQKVQLPPLGGNTSGRGSGVMPCAGALLRYVPNRLRSQASRVRLGSLSTLARRIASQGL